MSSETHVRVMEPADQAGVAAIVGALDLFPPEMVEELAEEPGSHWHVAVRDGAVVGVVYAVPEMLADGTWNLRAIGVEPVVHHSGAGRALMAAGEASARAAGGRVMIVDTSSDPVFEVARRFYAALGYVEEARIRDFWADGDDKVTFWKRL